MILVGSDDTAMQPREFHALPNNLRTWVTRYFKENVEDLFAEAFLVEQDAGTLGGAHFHVADQFQVVVGGSGLYGKTPVSRYSVHYAGAYSPYGPIRTSGEILKWYTLRNGPDPGGIKWMPASRERLRAGSRKPRVVLGEPEISLQPDGLGAWHHVIAPGGHVGGPTPSSGRGQYWIVLEGSGSVAGRELQAGSLLFASPSEAPVEVLAGRQGIEVLALQFPSANADAAR